MLVLGLEVVLSMWFATKCDRGKGACLQLSASHCCLNQHTSQNASSSSTMTKLQTFVGRDYCQEQLVRGEQLNADCTEIVAAGMAVGTFLLPGLHAASMTRLDYTGRPSARLFNRSACGWSTPTNSKSRGSK
eukprot:1161555-Pelagomonas_calceolata.AAC.1